jgi:hypothetical protein
MLVMFYIYMKKTPVVIIKINEVITAFTRKP